MLMMSPPHRRYMLLSARVENCGPSMTTRVPSVCNRGMSVGLTCESNESIACLTSGPMNCVEAIRGRLSARGSVLRVPEGLGKQVSAKRRGAHLAEFDVERLAEHGVSDHGLVKVGRFADALQSVVSVLKVPPWNATERTVTHLCSVNDLVGDDNVARADLFLEAAYGREGDDGLDSEVLQGGNVGAGGDFRGRDRVVEAVAGEERERDFASRGLERGDGDG